MTPDSQPQRASRGGLLKWLGGAFVLFLATGWVETASRLGACRREESGATPGSQADRYCRLIGEPMNSLGVVRHVHPQAYLYFGLPLLVYVLFGLARLRFGKRGLVASGAVLAALILVIELFLPDTLNYYGSR